MKRQPAEKISAIDVSSEGFQNRETVHTTQQEKTNNTIGKQAEDGNSCFSEEDTQVPKRHRKDAHHPETDAREGVEGRAPLCCRWGWGLAQPLWRAVWGLSASNR